MSPGAAASLLEPTPAPGSASRAGRGSAFPTAADAVALAARGGTGAASAAVWATAASPASAAASLPSSPSSGATGDGRKRPQRESDAGDGEHSGPKRPRAALDASDEGGVGREALAQRRRR
jgi:hypothetical protein